MEGVVFSYESFFMHQLGDSPARPAGRAGTSKGKAHPSRRLQAHHPLQNAPIKYVVNY